MQLTQEQILAVKDALNNGASISDIQKLLAEKFSISMTFMETRFLLDDLDLELKSAPEPKKDENLSGDDGLDISKVPETPKAESAADAPQGEGQSSGEVEVSLSQIQRPGFMASGTVRFSDGVSAEWGLDNAGRLTLGGPIPDYRPPDADIPVFQSKLYELLQGRV